MTAGRAELFRALGALCERPHPGHRALADSVDLPGKPFEHECTDLFVFQLYPYASVYLGADGMLGGEARDCVAGFWRALGLAPPTKPDHLSALLSLYASLMDAEMIEPDEARRVLLRDSRKVLLWEYLLSWLPAFIEKATQIAPPFYAGWAEVLAEALKDESRVLGTQDPLPLHLCSAPVAASTPKSTEEFISWLLAPVRSGLVLAPLDLQRAGADLGLGLRVGERRWILKSLLAHDPEATLSWLAVEAQRWAGLHGRWTPVTGDVASFWIDRAEATEDLILHSLARAGSSSPSCSSQKVVEWGEAG